MLVTFVFESKTHVPRFPSSVFFYMYTFMPQIFIEHLLWARHWAKGGMKIKITTPAFGQPLDHEGDKSSLKELSATTDVTNSAGKTRKKPC